MTSPELGSVLSNILENALEATCLFPPKKWGYRDKKRKHIVESYHGMLNFSQEGGSFITQIVLPVWNTYNRRAT